MPWVEDDSDVIEAPAPATGGRWVEDDTQSAPPLLDQFKRMGGLGIRTATHALTGIPEIIGNAANAAVNTDIEAFNNLMSLTGAKYRAPMLGSVTDAIDSGLTSAGVPNAETPVEKLTQVVGAAAGGAGAMKTLSGLPALVRGAPVFAELAKAPVAQAIGAGGAALATQGAEGLGIKNPYALGAMGMIGAALPGAGSKAALGTLSAAAKPFTRAGREVQVGNMYNSLATAPTLARENMANSAEIVPGSAPTVSQVARDPGLAGLESAMRGADFDPTNRIGQRNSQQNRARQEELFKVAGDEASVTTAKAAQKAAYDELAVPAFKSKTPINIGPEWINNPVRRTIQSLRETPNGARKTVRDALDEAEAQLTQKGVDLTDAETLYAIRKDLALARDGKLVGKGLSGIELANLKTAKSQINAVIDSLDDVIESGAPGFKNYLKVYAERSVPLDQLKAAQALRARAETAVIDQFDPAGNVPILGTRFGKLFRDNLDKGLNLRGTGPKAGNLTPSQLQTVQRVADDIDRGAAASASTVRVPGSETFKNMSMASVIGRILGDKTGKFVTESTGGKVGAKALGYLYHVPEKQIQQLLIESYLDPKLAARLMKQASEAEIESLASELGKRLSAQTAANTLYGNAE